MMQNIPTITYIMPYMIANGTGNYVLSKRKEKQIIAKFESIKASKTPRIIKKTTIPEELKDLVKVIEQNIDKNNLNNLYNNLKNATVKKNFLMLFMGIKGRYSSQKNKLEYSIDGSAEHEIIHLASSIYDKENNIWQSGFVNYSDNLIFGKALNEGYTDLTARRLFNKKTRCYNGEVRITQFIELLFTKEELEKYYFNNDIISVIKKLGSCIGINEAIKLIVTFDLGFTLKNQGNPAYKVIYTNLEIQLCEMFKQYNKSLLKQIDYLNLLDEAHIASLIINSKKRYLTRHKPILIK